MIDTISMMIAPSIVGVDDEDSGSFEVLMKFYKGTPRHNPENSSV